MVRHIVRFSLSTLLILLSLPFLAISFLLAAVCATAASALPHHRRQTDEAGVTQLGKADQFGFENAISAYEDLLGAPAWKKS